MDDKIELIYKVSCSNYNDRVLGEGKRMHRNIYTCICARKAGKEAVPWILDSLRNIFPYMRKQQC